MRARLLKRLRKDAHERYGMRAMPYRGKIRYFVGLREIKRKDDFDVCDVDSFNNHLQAETCLKEMRDEYILGFTRRMRLKMIAKDITRNIWKQ